MATVVKDTIVKSATSWRRKKADDTATGEECGVTEELGKA